MTDHTDLIAQLNNGWVARPKRWSGDTHHDFPYGNLDDKATDLLMEEAADALEAAQAEIDMHMRVATNAIDHVVTLKAEIEAVRKANIDCVNHFDALRIDYEAALARIAKLEPKRKVSPPSEELVLHKMRYHFWEADDDEPADFELFDSGVECDTCIDVALVRQDRLDELFAAAGASPQPRQAGEHCLWARNGHQPCQHTQPAQPAPRRLTEAEITLLVEAYYEDFGSAPPDLIRQVEGLIFGGAQPAQPGLPDCWVVLENGEIIGTHDAPVHIKGNAAIRYVPAQPAHAHAIDTSPERVEKQAGDVQVPGWLPIESAPKDGSRILIYTPSSRQQVQEVWWAIEYEGATRGYWQTPTGPMGRGYMILPESANLWQPLPAAPSTKEGQQ